MATEEKFMIELNDIDRKWYVFNKNTNRLEIRKDAPKEIQELAKENSEMLDDMERAFFGDFGKKKGKK
jgi:hypothetical protein